MSQFQTVESGYVQSLRANMKNTKAVVPWAEMQANDAFKMDGTLKRAKALAASSTANKYGNFIAQSDAQQFGDDAPRIICEKRRDPA